MPNSFFNRRKTVEIYFVLYLAALMLLIPDLKEKNINVNEKISDNSLFRIFPEKNVLNTRVSVDSLGMKVISSDSVNLIYYSGNIKNIEFEFQVENKSLNQVININSANNILDVFKFREVPELKAVFFIWKPPILDRRNYIFNVKVNANAIVEYYDKNTKTNIYRKLYSSTQFSLVVSYFDNQTGLPLLAVQRDTVTIPGFNSGINNQFFNTGEILFDFKEKKVNSLPSEEWSNTANIYGLNLEKELSGKPEIKVINTPENNSGSAYIKQYSNNSIVLAGKTPQYGNTRVKIKLLRKSDQSSVEGEFVVYPIPVTDPSFPSVIYPNQSYNIDPNLPEINNKNMFVKISLDNKIFYSSNNSNSFNFSVEDNLINKTIYFERFINGVLYGKSYPIQVKAYPSPQIARIQKISSKVAKVIINSFGYFEGTENYVKNIDLNGNATYSLTVGQSSFNRSNLMFTQIYEVRVKDESLPFEFKIRAADLRGFWSSWEAFP